MKSRVVYAAILTGAISYKRPKSLRDSRIKIPVRSYSPGCSVSHRFCINRPVLACLMLFSLNVRQSLAWRFSFLCPVIAAPSSKIFFVLRSPCPTKSLLFLRMGLLQRPLTLQLSRLRLQPTLPVTTTYRTLTTTWFLRPNLRLRRLVFSLVLVFVFLRAFFGLGVVGLLAWFSLLCY